MHKNTSVSVTIKVMSAYDTVALFDVEEKGTVINVDEIRHLIEEQVSLATKKTMRRLGVWEEELTEAKGRA